MYVYYVNKNRSHTVLNKNIFFASGKIDTLLNCWICSGDKYSKDASSVLIADNHIRQTHP